MALLSESASFVVCLALAVLTFSSMQTLRPLLTSSQPMTIVAGFCASLFFVFLLTALNNLEKVVFGKGFATKWVEVGIALASTAFAAASVHRVAATTSILFSLAFLYFINRMSAENEATSQAPSSSANATKKRK